MKTGPYEMGDQTWIRDQTARILHRHILTGKHWRLEFDELLSRAAQLRSSIPAVRTPAAVRKAA